MTPKSANSSSTSNFPRCQYRFSNGTRCRTPAVDADSRACARHSKLLDVDISSEPGAALTAGLLEFKSAVPINNFLSRLLLLLAQNRISPRRAAVLAFISSQLLRTLPAIDRESAANSIPNDAPSAFVWDIPGPPHERPLPPSMQPSMQTPSPVAS